MTHELPLPFDVKLTNLATSLLVAALVLGGVLLALWWGVRNPAFAIRQITVDGDTARNDATSLGSSVLPRLTGNFFTLDLAATQLAFQSAPWIRRAMVQREFPNKLHVTLQEHVPVAHWGDGAERLVNIQGELFEVPGGDAEGGDKPTLLGPDGESAQVLAMYKQLSPVVAPLGTEVAGLALLSRGDWRMELEQGAVIELGRGTPRQLTARLAQFVATVKEVAARHQRPVEAVEAADLRHSGGYALRLRGVSTVRLDPQAKPGPR
jgi:cell division protein FtsQ